MGGPDSQQQSQKQVKPPLMCNAGPAHLARLPLPHLIKY